MRQALVKFLSKPPFFTVLTRPILSPLTLSAMPRVQTDGSFGPLGSRTAVLYRDRKGVDSAQVRTYPEHGGSAESEWQSVLDGIVFAAKRNEGFLHLENDNRDVIQSLISRKAQLNYADYYADIIGHLDKFDYVGVRWIPREMNAADALFTKQEPYTTHTSSHTAAR